MKEQRLSEEKQLGKSNFERTSLVFKGIFAMMVIVFIASVVFLVQYQPAPSAPLEQITFEQKMAHLETGAPLPTIEQKPKIPRWMMVMILSFVVIQILPLLYASHKAQLKKFTRRDLRQIEFLTETPLHLGLMGSLLGVCMTHFLSGTLSAPLAYLTTISGILLYLFGRFTILVSLPSEESIS